MGLASPHAKLLCIRTFFALFLRCFVFFHWIGYFWGFLFFPLLSSRPRTGSATAFLFSRWSIGHKVEARSVNVMNTHTHTHSIECRQALEFGISEKYPNQPHNDDCRDSWEFAAHGKTFSHNNIVNVKLFFFPTDRFLVY